MAENKKSVLLYCDIIHTVKELSDEEAGVLFKHYLAYINDLNPVPKDKLTQIVFEPIKQNLKRDLEKWKDKSIKNKEIAIAGWEKRKNANAYESIKNDANYADKVKDKDKDKDIIIELDLYPTFNDFWNLYDYKVGLETTQKKWKLLNQKEKELIMDYLPQYKLSTPDKKFRKHPSTFLNQKTYKDEITTNQQSELGAIGFDNLTNFLQHERDLQSSNNLKLH